MRKIFVFIFLFYSTAISFSAVTSTGEINVVGDPSGEVPSSSTVDLILTVGIDRSLAEPGEEIKTIEIHLPIGFTVQADQVKKVTRDGKPIGADTKVIGQSLRIELLNPIDDFSNLLYEIIFVAKTPPITTSNAEFKVGLRNLQDRQIGEHIKSGNIDGKPNNNKLSLAIIPNIPPEAIKNFSAKSNLRGENDVLLKWQASNDLDVSGYLIFRDDQEIKNINDRNVSEWTDLNVPEGTHVYAIVTYKTLLLRSDPSENRSVNVSIDTAKPQPPTAIKLEVFGNIISITWRKSLSNDVIKYQIYFGTSTLNVKPIDNAEIAVETDREEYIFEDEKDLSSGSFVYLIVAIDEVGNESDSISETLRILDKPYPNPFTPLSHDDRFNRVTFPRRAIADADGEFIVRIFDLHGSEIIMLQSDPNQIELQWDGKDLNGEIVESGIYIYQIHVGESYDVGTLIVVK